MYSPEFVIGAKRAAADPIAETFTGVPKGVTVVGGRDRVVLFPTIVIGSEGSSVGAIPPAREPLFKTIEPVIPTFVPDAPQVATRRLLRRGILG